MDIPPPVLGLIEIPPTSMGTANRSIQLFALLDNTSEPPPLELLTPFDAANPTLISPFPSGHEFRMKFEHGN